MLLFRNCASGYPFLWDNSNQPAARWHAAAEGPAHYMASTPEGAWAEFLRAEEITEVEDIEDIRNRSLWMVEVDDKYQSLPITELADRFRTEPGISWEECQAEGARLRTLGAEGLRTPSAALDMTRWYSVENGQELPCQSEAVNFVFFGRRPEFKGHCITRQGQPNSDLLDRVLRKTTAEPPVHSDVAIYPPTTPDVEPIFVSSESGSLKTAALRNLWQSGLVLIVKDDEGRVKFCNQGFLDQQHHTDRREADFVGKTTSEYWPHIQAPAIERYDKAVRDNKQAILSRERYSRHYRFSLRFPIRDYDRMFGSLGIWFSKMQDSLVPHSFRSDVAISVTVPPDTLIEAFFDSCPTALSIRELTDQSFVYVNPAFCRVFSSPGQELDPSLVIGRTPRAICSDDYWREYESKLMRSTKDIVSYGRLPHP